MTFRYHTQVLMRVAVAEDVPKLSALFRDTVLRQGPQHYIEAQVQAWAAATLDEEAFQQFILNVTTYVAEAETGILGFAGLGQDGRIASLYVRHTVVGRGIGSTLLGHLLKMGERDRISRFFTEASEFSVGLFSKFGFHTYAMESMERHGVLFDRYLMERVLADFPHADVR